MTEKSSNIPGFYKLSVKDRLKVIKNYAGLSDEEVELLEGKEVSFINLANNSVGYCS